MEERDDYIPEQKGNEKRITPFERFVPGIIPAHEIACQNQENATRPLKTGSWNRLAKEKAGAWTHTIRHAARNRDMSIQCSRDEGNKIVGFCGVMKESAFGAP